MGHRILAILVVVAALSAPQSAFGQNDIKGSQDHPLITRMPGYYISSYKVEEFAGFESTVIGGEPVRWEGRKYSIAYTRKEGAPVIGQLQITRNYAAAIGKAGGSVLGSDERRVAAHIKKGSALTGVYVEVFNDGRDYELTIGHTDNVGGLDMNLKLSGARADAVMKALVARGIAATRLKASGVGPYSPIASNRDEAGKAQNRRVELVEQ